MGCVSSALLNHDEDFSQIGSSRLGHHIVSLTSTTYGLLNVDAPSDRSPTVPPTPPTRFTLGSLFPTPPPEIRSPLSQPPEVINSWELMAGLDSASTPTTTDSFRFYPLPSKRFLIKDKENSNPNLSVFSFDNSIALKPPIDVISRKSASSKSSLDGFEELCPPTGENKVVIYTTTLRGVRKTFEDCNDVRAAIEGVGVAICERDISMDKGFREELRELMSGKESSELVPPRVFVKGRYIGGSETVMRIMEDGFLGELLQGLPKVRAGHICEGCGGVRFLPCFQCNGSCKMAIVVKEEMNQTHGKTVTVKCSDCNENGLVLCPICS